jgi:membrane protein YdbS with pleckstrin-like domain
VSAADGLLRFLRVPAAPSAPAGDDEIHVFRAAPNFFRYRIIGWIVKQVGAVIGLVFGVLFLRGAPGMFPTSIRFGGLTLSESTILTVLYLVELGAIAAFIVQAAFSLALLRLDFEQRWYIVTDRSLRIREGLVRLHEKTMTFANIQHLTIKQGPLQRLFGIADLEVRTAGGGGSGDKDESAGHEDLHVAYFRGVDRADHIRDTVRERLRRLADAGLGDPDDAVGPEPLRPHAPRLDALRPDALRPDPGTEQPGTGSTMGLLDAARALSEEARLLRSALARDV